MTLMRVGVSVSLMIHVLALLMLRAPQHEEAPESVRFVMTVEASPEPAAPPPVEKPSPRPTDRRAHV